MKIEELQRKIRWRIELDGRMYRELANDSGFSVNSINNILRPTPTISLLHLIQLCDALGLELDFELKEKS